MNDRELKDIDIKPEFDSIDKNNKHQLEIENNKKEEEDDHDLRVNQNKFRVPNELKCTFITTALLFVVGSLLIGLGFIEAIWSEVPGISISMWTLGGITFIPGGYYAYQFYKAYKAEGDERDEILDAIPEL